MHPFFSSFFGPFTFGFMAVPTPAEPAPAEPAAEAVPASTPPPALHSQTPMSVGVLLDHEVFKAKELDVHTQEIQAIHKEMVEAMKPFQRRLMVASSRQKTADVEFAAMLEERIGVPMTIGRMITADNHVILAKETVDALGLSGTPYGVDA